MAFQTTAANANNPNWAEQNATITFTNFSEFISTTGTTGVGRMVSAQDPTTRLTIIMDNNGRLLNNKLVAFGNDSPSGAANNNSILRLINNGNSVLNLGTFRQLATASQVELAGTLLLTIVPGAFPAVFWSNANAANSTIRFTNTADVSFLSSVVGNANVRLTNGPANSGNPDNATYNFFIDDGARVNLNITGQNVLGVSNFGVQIGSYDPLTGFGPGAVLQLNNWSNTASIINNQISNLSSTNATAAIFNGPTSNNSVIYNLAPGSNIVAVSNALVSGIIARKSTGTGNIYIRSGALISDGTSNVSLGTGITAESTTAAATGNILVRNEGTILKATGILLRISSTVGTGNIINRGIITSTVAGINLLSDISDRITLSIDNTQGVINANSGSAINVFNLNTNLDLLGGQLNINGIDPAVNINTDNPGAHTITGVTFNINSNAPAFPSGTLSTFNLYDDTFSITNGTLFPEMRSVNFLYGSRNNIVNILGSGSAIAKSFNGIDLSNAFLTINATGAGSIGLSTSGELPGDANVTVGANAVINTTAGTAVNFNNNIPQSLINNGTINGSVSMGNSENSVINSGVLYSLTSGTGNDTLTLNTGSVSNGLIDLDTGNNTVNVYDGSSINSVTTGAGNDIFNIYNLTPISVTSLGVFNAGGGVNTLNFIDSVRTLNDTSRLQNFSDVNLNGSSAITLSNSNNITTGTVNLTPSTSQLLFGNAYNGAFTPLITGAGNITIQNAANVTLSNANSFSGSWLVNASGILNANNFTQLGTASLALNGILNMLAAGTFNNVLTGSGLFNVNSTNDTFNFSAGVGSAFSGIFDLSNATLNLSPTNTNVLTNATLRNSTGGWITMPTGTSHVGNLTLNGGTLAFASGGVVNTGTLAVQNGSFIRADPTIFTSGNLLDWDVGTITPLIQSNNSLSTAALAQLQLQDLSGNNLGTGTTANYFQSGNLVSVNTYNFGLISNLGLGLTEHLTQANIQAGQTLTLSSNGASNSILDALLTGSGNLAIGADNVALTFNNPANNYSGTTTVNGGSLMLGASNALGNTSALSLLAGSTVYLSGHSQTVGTLNNAGTVNFNGGALDLTNGGTSSFTGGLTGAGALNIDGGLFTVNAANSDFSAQTTIASGAAATLNAAGGALGSGGIGIDGTLNLNAADAAFANLLTGAGLVNIGAAVQLTGSNSNFGGRYDINTNASLTATRAANLGDATVDLTASSAQLILHDLNDTLGNTLIGVTGSAVQVENGSMAYLTGNNSGFNGQFNIDGSSNLTVYNRNNLGSGSVNIAGGGQLTFDNYTGGALTSLGNAIHGAGTWLLNNSNINLSGNSAVSTFTGVIDINNASSLTLDSTTALNTAATIDVLNNADTLNISSTGAFTLGSILTGAGRVNVDTGNNVFAFSNANNAYTGTIILQNALFSLAGINAATLSNASLILNSGSSTTVGIFNTPNTENLVALTLNGGTLGFYGNLPSTSADTLLNTTTLSASGGVINLLGNGVVDSTPGSGSLLNQIPGTAGMQLVSATTASGAATLTLQINGVAVGTSTTSAIVQGGLQVANGLYNYGLSNSGANGAGLYLSYTLTELDLLLDGANALVIATDVLPTSNRDLSVQVTGGGGLVLDATQAPLTISNGSNSYNGTTSVRGGSVLLGASGALGVTSLLTVDSSASFNTNSFSQTVGSLTNTGIIDLAGGTLNLTAGGSSTATAGLTGAGELNVDGGTLNLGAANGGLSAATRIATGATVDVTAAMALGSSAVEVDGTLTLTAADTLANLLSGAGTINTDAAVTLSGSNSFSGTHAVNTGGALIVSAANNLGTPAARITLTVASAQLLLNGLSGTLANTLSGVANSTVQLSNSAATTLTGSNDTFAGLFDLIGNSALTVSQTANLGIGRVSIGSGSTLNFDTFSGSTLSNSLSGLGNWVLRNTTLNLVGSTLAGGFGGTLNINTNSALTLNGATALNATAVLHVNDATSTLNIANAGAFTLSNVLTGAGQVNVDTANGAFNFGAGVGNGFTGNVTLNNATFSLSGANASPLAGAGLTLGVGSNTIVGIDGIPSTENVGNVNLTGGTLNFYGGLPNASADSILNTTTLSASSGVINLQGNGTVESIPGSGSLLNQIPGTAGMQLASANTASGAENLTLQINGVAAGTGTTSVITKSGLEVANGLYNYGLSNTGANGAGLYLSYTLTELDLLLDGANALVIATDALPTSNRDLSVQVAGAGGVVLDGTLAPLTISNGSNSYSGTTTVRGGSVLLGASGALGATSLLTVDSGASFNTNSFSQTVGGLSNTGIIDLAGAP